jgi:hypothetical protein
LWCDEFEINNPVIQRIINTPNQEEAQIEEKQSNHSQERELKSLQEKAMPNEFKSQISEKAPTPNDETKLVNISEGHNNHKNKFFLVEENESKTENEFVFSENVNIDTLSYNEPIIDRAKSKKDEQDQQKE